MVIITTNTANISLEFDTLTDDIEKLITAEVKAYRNELVRITPVDSGEMRNSWGKVEYNGNWHWHFKNTADHAFVIARGRRKLLNQNGLSRWYGARGIWHNGIRPFMKRFERKLLGKINNMDS